MDIIRLWYKTFLALITTVLLAFGLRIYNLTIIPVFVDEAIYIRWAQVMTAVPSLRFLPLSDGKQPLFMWIVMPFLKIFSDPLFAGRMVSILSGMVSLIGIFVLSYLLFRSKKAALLASFIYSISPFAIFFDRLALADSMLSTFGIWTVIFVLLAVKLNRLDMALFGGFSLGGALITKSPALFFSLLIPLTAVFSTWKNGIFKNTKQVLKLMFLFGVTYALGYGIYNILRLGGEFHQIAKRNLDYVFPISHLWTNPFDPFEFFVDRSFEWISMMGPSLIIALAFFGIAINIKKYTKEILLLGLFFITPILIQSEFAKVFTARYILFTLPYLYILASTIFLAEKKLLRAFTVLILLAFIFQAGWLNLKLLTDPVSASLPNSERSGYLEEWTAGTGNKEISEIVKKQSRDNPNQKILVGTEGYFGTLPDGLQIYLEGESNISVLGVGLELEKVPVSLIDSYNSGNKTYFVVNSSRLKIKEKDYERNWLKLLNSYKKAERLDKESHDYIWYGDYEYLLFFEIQKPIVPQK